MDIGDPNAWDDTVLIKAFQTAVDAHTPMNKRGRVNKARISPGNTQKKQSTKQNNQVQTESLTTDPTTPELPPPATLNREQPVNQTESTEILIPPPPPTLFGSTVTKDMEKLLMAWYEAGYRAGVYAASQQREHMTN